MLKIGSIWFRDLIRSHAPQYLLELHRWRWQRRKGRRDRYIVDEFHKIFYPTRVHQAYWLGVPAIKCPLDCWVYSEIIFATRPDIIVETGVRYGGTTLYLASMLDLIGTGEVIGVDIELCHAHEAVKCHSRIQLIEGSSVDPLIFERVLEIAYGKRTMVILDSNHHAHHVLRELQLYGRLVTPGCYMVCEDTNLNGNPVYSPVRYDPGPWEAVEMFLKEQGALWEVDKTCEKFLMTCNPGGYLKRKQLNEPGPISGDK